MSEKAASPVDTLQNGIYYKTTPKASYRLLLLNIKPQTNAGEARTAIEAVWGMLQKLRVRELAPDVPSPEPARGAHEPDLSCLLGFGASLFDRYQSMQRPDGLCCLGAGPFRKLHWVADADRR